MKVAVFTCNQARHLSLVTKLAKWADEVFVVQEVNTVFPGQVDDFFKKSSVMQNYFARVLEAEQRVFGTPHFLEGNVHQLVMRSGDLNKVPLEWLEPALTADLIVVFGGSFIRGPLCERLIEKRALNIHMGVSPYYRGSSCNFWAVYDNHPEYVGGTIHLLSKGLDSGPILFHALPEVQAVDGFLLGMLAVRASHDALVEHLRRGTLKDIVPVTQDKRDEIRYTRNAEFTDEIASEYLARMKSPDEIADSLRNRDLRRFVNPVII